jgi:hypothetical protein
MLRVVCAIAALCLFAPGALAADTAAQAAKKWGLLGTWKIDCAAPASVANSEFTYTIQDGRLFHDRNFGDHQDSNAITKATIRRDGAIVLIVQLASIHQVREYAFIKGNDGRLRAVSNKDAKTGEHTIRDGKFADGRETSWQTLCR